VEAAAVVDTQEATVRVLVVVRVAIVQALLVKIQVAVLLPKLYLI
jgi:hypothetical protein